MLIPKTTYLFLIFLTLSACSSEKEAPTPITCTPQELEADPEGEWYRGDFHVHATGASNDTGGDSFPADIKEKAKQRGLQFVVLTDHSNSTGSDPSTLEEDPALFNQAPEFPYWDIAAELTENEAFLMICGNEISPVAEDNNLTQPTGHIGCVPIDLETFDTETPFIDRPKGTVTGGDALQQAQSRGCFAILNHPYSISWTSYDWTSFDYDAIEIWNGTLGYDVFDINARKAWLCDLLAGRNVVAVGGSDNHRVFIAPPGSGTDPALGYPTTAVFATALTWPAIMEGLQAGQTAIFEGDSRLYLDAYNAEGCRAEGGESRILRLRGRIDAQLPDAKVVLTRAVSCQDPRPDYTQYPEVDEQLLLEKAVISTQFFDFQVPIQGEKGVYSAVLSGNSFHHIALSRAIVID